MTRDHRRSPPHGVRAAGAPRGRSSGARGVPGRSYWRPRSCSDDSQTTTWPDERRVPSMSDRRGASATRRPMAASTSSATASSHVTSHARPSGPCSAWRITSIAANSAGLEPSADHLRWPRRRRYADDPCDQLFRDRDIDVARSDDHIDGPNRLGAVGDRGDGLGPADGDHLVDAGHRSCGQSDVGNAVHRTRRNTQDDLGDPRPSPACRRATTVERDTAPSGT